MGAAGAQSPYLFTPAPLTKNLGSAPAGVGLSWMHEYVIPHTHVHSFTLKTFQFDDFHNIGIILMKVKVKIRIR